jgi:hypothetical protein
VLVSVSELQGDGQPCPIEDTNLVSNRNLFTAEEQRLLGEVFVKYKHVTTNIGPAGSILVSLDKTNSVVPFRNRTNAYWRAIFEYTNSGAQEEVIFVQGISARFRDKAGDGYVVGFGNIAGNLSIVFEQTKAGIANGLHVECIDVQKSVLQGSVLASEFTGEHVTTYQHMTNGMAIGKYLLWNPQNNNLILKAEFMEPYDMKKHRVLAPIP